MDVGYIWLITILLLMILGIYVRSNAWINFLNDQKQKKKQKNHKKD